MNMVTRPLGTPVKSIKTDVLSWYSQCFVGSLLQGVQVQNDAKSCFSSKSAARPIRSCYVGRLVYVFPETGVDEFVISVFQGMWQDFFQPHPRSIEDLCACQFGFAFDFACLCPFWFFMDNWADSESFPSVRSLRSLAPTLTTILQRSRRPELKA